MINQIFLKFGSMSAFKNWPDYQKRLNLIFHTIVAITMLPFVWLLLKTDGAPREGLTQDPVVLVLFLAVCISLTLTGFLYKKKQMGEAIHQPELRQKLIVYQRILVVMYVFLESAAVFSTLAFYLTANYLFVLMYVIVLFVFTLGRPHLARTCTELHLSSADRGLLTDGGTIPE